MKTRPPSPVRPLTGALLFTGLGIVLILMALAGLLGYGANLVGSGPDNVAAQNVMLCLGLVSFTGSLASFVLADRAPPLAPVSLSRRRRPMDGINGADHEIRPT